MSLCPCLCTCLSLLYSLAFCGMARLQCEVHAPSTPCTAASWFVHHYYLCITLPLHWPARCTAPACRGEFARDSDLWQYSNSKLMSIMAAREMARRLKESAGCRVPSAECVGCHAELIAQRKLQRPVVPKPAHLGLHTCPLSCLHYSSSVSSCRAAELMSSPATPAWCPPRSTTAPHQVWGMCFFANSKVYSRAWQGLPLLAAAG